MEFFSLKCFVEVVRQGSFSKAADKLFRTQPAISLQIRKLEQELKQPLLDRYRKQITLTEAGQILYKNTKELLERIEDVKRLASLSISEPEGEITIASNLSLINNFLPPFISELHRKHPKVKIKFLNVTSKKLETDILEGNAEVGIGFPVKPNPEIKAQKILESEFILTAKDSAQAKQPLDKILEGPCVHFEAEIELRQYIEHNLKTKRALKVSLELPSIESILNYVHAGLGYSILPDFTISGHWRKDLAVKKIPGLPPLAIFAYTRRKRLLSKAAEKFLEIIKKKLANSTETAQNH